MMYLNLNQKKLLLVMWTLLVLLRAILGDRLQGLTMTVCQMVAQHYHLAAVSLQSDHRVMKYFALTSCQVCYGLS